jgi:hypothetical protein
MLEIDDLIALFAPIPSTIICRGPEHPTEPDLSLAERLRQWLATHPFLHQDQGYVDFLKRYCGAAINDREGRFQATVHGFHPEVGYLDEYDFCLHDTSVRAFDGRGLYQFALMGYQRAGEGKFLERQVLVDFCFDGTGARPWGVYRSVLVGRQSQGPEALICGSFSEWLGKVYIGEAHPAVPIPDYKHSRAAD